MVKFVAYKGTDNTDLSEIGLFKNIKKNLDRKGEGKKFDASKGDIDMHVTGSAMLFAFKKPVSGVMKTIDVKVGDVDQYFIKGIDLKIRKMSDFFSGNYEKKLFKGDDKIVGSSQKDKLAGFDGKDTIQAGSGGDNVGGGKGNDKLSGQAGNDVMAGNAGNDWLDGGDGFNTLSGGGGKDTFHFSSQLSAGNVSSITDFKSGADKIELVRSVFPDLTGKGTLAADKFVKLADYSGQDNVIVYDKATGALSYAIDPNNLIKFAEVTVNLNLKNTDIILA